MKKLNKERGESQVLIKNFKFIDIVFPAFACLDHNLSIANFTTVLVGTFPNIWLKVSKLFVYSITKSKKNGGKFLQSCTVAQKCHGKFNLLPEPPRKLAPMALVVVPPQYRTGSAVPADDTKW